MQALCSCQTRGGLMLAQFTELQVTAGSFSFTQVVDFAVPAKVHGAPSSQRTPPVRRSRIPRPGTWWQFIGVARHGE